MINRHADYVRAITEVGKALTSNLQPERVISTIMDSCSRLLEPQHWSLLMLDEASNTLGFEVAIGPASEKLKSLRLQMGEGVAGWVAQHRQPVVVARVADDPRFCSRFDQATEFATQSIACAPLISRGRLLGVIELIKDSHDPYPYCAADLELSVPFADFAAIAIDNARTFKQVENLTLMDACTGLHNRRFLDTFLRDEVVRATRYERPLSLVFIDLDHFKRVNDTLGHEVGTSLLASVGRLLRVQTRETDRAIRTAATSSSWCCRRPVARAPWRRQRASKKRSAI